MNAIERTNKATETTATLNKVIAQYNLKHSTTYTANSTGHVVQLNILGGGASQRIQLWFMSKAVDVFVGVGVLAMLDNAKSNIFTGDYMESKREKDYVWRFTKGGKYQQEKFTLSIEDFDTLFYNALCGLFTGEFIDIDKTYKAILTAIAQDSTQENAQGENKPTENARGEKTTAKRTGAKKGENATKTPTTKKGENVKGEKKTTTAKRTGKKEKAQ